MIAKRVHRAKGGSFKRLAGYIAKREAIKWQRTADYILDALGKGARATGVRITNCQAEELEDALAEITATQKRNRRARGERTYHLVISFPEGERPAPDQLRDIEDELCAAIGLGAHQRLSAIHIDTAHLHIHVAINQVHPQTLALIEPWYDKVKLMAACERLEIKHGLQRTSHRSGERPTSGRAADMEAQTGELSFTGWLKRDVAPSLYGLLDEGGSWEALHKALGAHGLVIRKRGAGLVIAQAVGGQAVKVSSIDRRLSFKSLDRRWGPLLPAKDPQSYSRPSGYRKAPLQEGPGIKALYAAYQRQRPQTLALRSAAFRDFQNEDAKRREALRHWSRDATARIRRQAGITRQERRIAISRHKMEAQRAFADQRAQSRQEWRILRTGFPALSWHGFLEEAARCGNHHARLALDRRKARFVQAVTIIDAGNPGWPDDPAIQQQFRPAATGEGVSYRTGDSGRIIDCHDVIYLPGDSREAILLSFSILGGRFAGATIRLEGDTSFVQTAIEIAVNERPHIRFADKAHEARRQQLTASIARPEPEREEPRQQGIKR